MDETFIQLIGEVREPLPAEPGRVARYDSVYVRNGVTSVFLTFEPLAGWRDVQVTAERTRQDFAQVVRTLLDGRYRGADKIVLVIDQLNTHSMKLLRRRRLDGSPSGWRFTTRRSTGAGWTGPKLNSALWPAICRNGSANGPTWSGVSPPGRSAVTKPK
ncbi:protein of unknown function [Methylocaldum szegediense]|uniref:Tc1-like transposase DDE domain-containing protein n=1 Tax=Methylocaldum szegediense TaxID=73780 RepID=A0ABN8X4Q1_9GAMM|nr:protein of unknown function [Methylocaldum szegediense]